MPKGHRKDAMFGNQTASGVKERSRPLPNQDVTKRTPEAYILSLKLDPRLCSACFSSLRGHPHSLCGEKGHLFFQMVHEKQLYVFFVGLPT